MYDKTHRTCERERYGSEAFRASDFWSRAIYDTVFAQHLTSRIAGCRNIWSRKFNCTGRRRAPYACISSRENCVWRTFLCPMRLSQFPKRRVLFTRCLGSFCVTIFTRMGGGGCVNNTTACTTSKSVCTSA